jgi:acyl carrier protein
MPMENIGQQVKEIIIKHLDVDAEKVTDKASFREDLGTDSLDIVELIMEFEEKFGCTIPDDAAEKLKTVGDVIAYIEEQAN